MKRFDWFDRYTRNSVRWGFKARGIRYVMNSAKFMSKLCIVLILLSGCYSAKKAEKQLNKAIDEYPEVAAKVTRNNFPCIEKPVSTVTDTVYSLIELECPEIPTPGVVTKRDTLWRDKPVKLQPGRQVVYLPSEKVKETIKIEDSAKVLIAYAERDKAREYLRDTEAKAERRGKWNLWLIIALLLSWGVFFVNRKFRLI